MLSPTLPAMKFSPVYQAFRERALKLLSDKPNIYREKSIPELEALKEKAEPWLLDALTRYEQICSTLNIKQEAQTTQDVQETLMS